METMMALHQNKYGSTSDMELGQIPKPVPADGEVLLRVKAAALNPIDIKRNAINPPESFPVIVGYDVAGVVEAVGPSVTNWKAGDKVFGDVMPRSMGPKVTGTVSEFCVCRADLLGQVPAGKSMVDAAALPVASETAVEAFELAGCKNGDKVFISGGAGGVGIHSIQVAKALFGANQVATTASAGKEDFVRKYGADHVVDYKKKDAGNELAGWADIAMDCTHEAEMCLKIIKKGGVVVSLVDNTKADVRYFELAPTRTMIEKVATLFDDGKLRAAVDSVFSIDEWETAVHRLESGHAKGKVVIRIAE